MLKSVRFSCEQFRILKHIKYDFEIRTYARWSRRKPATVLTSEDFINKTDDDFVNCINENDTETLNIQKTPLKQKSVNTEHVKYIDEHSNIKGIHQQKSAIRQHFKFVDKVKKSVKQKNKNEDQTFDMLQTIIDSNGEFIYSKMANNDPRISNLLTVVKSKKEKSKKGLILLEGKRLINEALQSKCKLHTLIFSRKHDLEYFKQNLPKLGAALYKMPYREMQMWSDLTVCPGVLGIFHQPDTENVALKNSIPITVICDNIREPGNLGTILRTCAAVGCQNVLLTKGCVNLWDTKVTRSGSGAHFRLNIHSKLDWPSIETRLSTNSHVFIADNNRISSTQLYPDNSVMSELKSLPFVPYYGIQFNQSDSIALIIGGETEGLSYEAFKCAHNFKGVRLNIPLANGVDSLNAGVALGVILYEIKRQLSVLQSHEVVSHNVG